MVILKASIDDIPAMQLVFEAAKRKMRASGNMLQWTGGYPTEEILRNDIQRGFSYVICHKDCLVATFVLALCEEPTYRHIYEGQWTDDTMPYATIHRIASTDGCHGVLEAVIEFSKSVTSNLRIDTHRDNVIMRHLLRKHGFTYCGIIYLTSGDERLAFQKIYNVNRC
ncbi:MAG: GNAT family N-acetyltransferase [Bacteroidales bacterium]|nr:GNAT family N-acetyltransferase [Bacteroidales bacterium]